MIRHPSMPGMALFRSAAIGAAFLSPLPALACQAHDLAATHMSSPAVDAMTTASSHVQAGMAHVGAIMIEGFWARAMLPNQPVAGGFLTLTNGGDADDRLIKASSPRAGRMELHEMLMDGDVMKMREVEGGIAVPAGATVALEPGGLHLMFFDIAERFEEGQSVPVTLTFEKTGDVTIDLPVMAKPMQGHMGGHGAHSHGG
jgi:periplasmic copper chaperone A